MDSQHIRIDVDPGVPGAAPKTGASQPLHRSRTRPIVSLPLPEVHVRDEFVKGDPSPFGLLTFGMTTMMISFIATGWTDDSFMPYPIVYGLFMGGLGQLLAGMLELIKGDTFAGTAFASYGCFWMGWGWLNYSGYAYPEFRDAAEAGRILFASLWCLLTFGLLVVTVRKNVCMQVILVLVTIDLALQAGGVRNPSVAKASGYFGFAASAAAIYAAFAFLYQIELGWELPGVRPVKLL